MINTCGSKRFSSYLRAEGALFDSEQRGSATCVESSVKFVNEHKKDDIDSTVELFILD